MPSLDMPLEELRKYSGTNPIPDDFDSFWNERMNEADNFDINYIIQMSEIQGYDSCKFYDLYFDGINGEKLYAKYIHPQKNENVPVVLQFHGYPGSSRSWFEQLSFVGMGCAVVALDCPGQGGKSQDSGSPIGTTVAGHIVLGLDSEPKEMYYVRLYQNIRILCRIIENIDGIDKEKIYANGASQGGALALACTALNSCIKKCGALYPFLSDFKRVWDMDLDQIAYEGIRYYSKWFDPIQESQNDVFLKLGYIDIQNFAHMIKADVLFGTGLIDNICPPSTQFAVFNKINSKKEHYIFYDYTHEEISEFDDLLINFFSD